MADTSTDHSTSSAGIDLSQFYQVFFEEAGENLENMEQLLLELDIEAADDEELNAIFRCAHSIKGGAATFGFSDVAELTHQMETLLDKLRRHELTPTAPMVDVLLQSGDALKAMLGRHQGSGADGAPRPPPPRRPPTWSTCSRKSPTWAPSRRCPMTQPSKACAASRSPPPPPSPSCWTCSPSTWRASRWPSWPSVARPSQLGTRLTASSMHRTQAKPPPLKRATASSTTPRARLISPLLLPPQRLPPPKPLRSSRPPPSPPPRPKSPPRPPRPRPSARPSRRSTSSSTWWASS